MSSCLFWQPSRLASASCAPSRREEPLVLRPRVESSAVRVDVRPWGCSVTSQRCSCLEGERGRGYNCLDSMLRE